MGAGPASRRPQGRGARVACGGVGNTGLRRSSVCLERLETLDSRVSSYISPALVVEMPHVVVGATLYWVDHKDLVCSAGVVWERGVTSAVEESIE